jgi:aryl-alcohol dehydrogenase-like predicted oxidoreductase
MKLSSIYRWVNPGFRTTIGEFHTNRSQRAWELGFITFDTSNFYCNGVSEEILGKFLKTVPREAVVVMTKVAALNIQLHPV